LQKQEQHEQAKETNFWLYTQMFEHIFPVGFYCQLVEPQVLVKVLVWLFTDIDKSSAQQFGMVTELTFLKQFMNGFQEGFSESVSFAILDLLFLLGSGT